MIQSPSIGSPALQLQAHRKALDPCDHAFTNIALRIEQTPAADPSSLGPAHSLQLHANLKQGDLIYFTRESTELSHGPTSQSQLVTRLRLKVTFDSFTAHFLLWPAAYFFDGPHTSHCGVTGL